jgi:tetratricopeptide (TPR) repeat protein
MKQNEPKRELDDALHQRIVELSERGNQLAEAGQPDAALAAFEQALALLPAPFEDWEAGLWLQVAIGDTHFGEGRLQPALQAFQLAMRCPDALGSPFIHLRLGQIHHDLGQLDKAADELARAYMAEGPPTFEGEHPRYLAFLRTRMHGI